MEKIFGWIETLEKTGRIRDAQLSVHGAADYS
jgi:hypothetical protein